MRVEGERGSVRIECGEKGRDAWNTKKEDLTSM
jgi:hypothetical protein